MNLFSRTFLLVCVALNLAACSANNMSRLDVEGLNPPAAYADSEEFDDVDSTEPVVLNTVDGQCHRLDPPAKGWVKDSRPAVFIDNGKPHRVQLDGTACIPGMRIVTEMAIVPANG